MSEKKLLNDIMKEHTREGGRIFRNNVGTGWVGKFKRRYENGDVLVGNARPLHAGLCVGSSDLIGWIPVTITDGMVGKKLAVFTAVECKTARVPTTTHQKNFIKTVTNSGGVGFVCRNLDQYKKEVNKWNP